MYRFALGFGEGRLWGICFALMLREGRHCGHMLGVHAPWRSSRLEYV
jgi:hypothetical protein